MKKRPKEISTIRCDRCHVAVPSVALDTPNRCTDWRCPTSTEELRLEYARRVGRVADFLALLDQRVIDRLAAKYPDLATDRARALADLEGA